MPSQNIIQRRGTNSAGALPTLPLTSNDVVSSAGASSSGAMRQLRSKNRKIGTSISPYDRTSLIRWTVLIIISILLASIIWKPVLSLFGLKTPSHNKDHHLQSQRPKTRQLNLPLSQFSDLSYALENSDLVALYFAASWCPHSTPISFALDEAFGKRDLLLSPKGGRKDLSVVYVSSDKTESEYQNYLNVANRNWIAIPFESTQRNQLKKHFATCAHRELEELGIDRKHEIPTIIVIDSETQGIITTSGADDVDELGTKALDHWKDMQRWLRRARKEMS